MCLTVSTQPYLIFSPYYSLAACTIRVLNENGFWKRFAVPLRVGRWYLPRKQHGWVDGWILGSSSVALCIEILWKACPGLQELRQNLTWAAVWMSFGRPTYLPPLFRNVPTFKWRQYFFKKNWQPVAGPGWRQPIGRSRRIQSQFSQPRTSHLVKLCTVHVLRKANRKRRETKHAKYVAWPSCAWLLVSFFLFPVRHPLHPLCTVRVFVPERKSCDRVRPCGRPGVKNWGHPSVDRSRLPQFLQMVHHPSFGAGLQKLVFCGTGKFCSQRLHTDQ